MGFIAGAALAAFSVVEQEQAKQDRQQAQQEQRANMAASAAEQRKQFEADQRIADIQNMRSRAEMARKARIARGQVLNEAADNGAIGSSGVLGGMGSIATQGASAMGTFSAIQQNQIFITESKKTQSIFDVNAGVAAGNIAAAQGDIAEWQNIFNIGTSFMTAGGKKT